MCVRVFRLRGEQLACFVAGVFWVAEGVKVKEGKGRDWSIGSDERDTKEKNKEKKNEREEEIFQSRSNERRQTRGGLGRKKSTRCWQWR